MVRRVAIRSLLLPGFGDPAGSKRRMAAVTVLGVVVGSIATARLSNAEARRYYDDYLAAVTPAVATELYQKAEHGRTSGTAYTAIAAGGWLGSVLETTWREVRFARRLERVQGYHAAPEGPRLSVSPSGVGLTLTIF